MPDGGCVRIVPLTRTGRGEERRAHAEVNAVTGVVENNPAKDVTWVPEAIRQVAGTNSLPVDSIVEVRVLDPHRP
jgi:hypothetical protein